MLGQPLDREMIVVDHAAKQGFGNCSRAVCEHPEIAADDKVRSIAGDQHGAHIGPFGNLGCGLGEIGGHLRIDRVALIRAI